MTGVDKDLATLRSWALGQGDKEALEILARVEAELPRLRELCVAIDTGTFDTQRERAEAAETEVSRLREQLDAAERGRDSLMDEIQREYVLASTHAARVGAVEARCARLQQALADAQEARRGIIAACIAVKGKLDEPYPDDERWTPWTRFVEPALRRLDEALAGTGSEQSSLTESGSAGLPDTPACDHEWVQEHGTSGRYCVVCGAGPDKPVDSQEDKT